MAYSPRSGGMKKTKKSGKTFLERFGTASQRKAGDKRMAEMESKPKPKPKVKPKAAAAKPKASSSSSMVKPGGGRKRPSQKVSPGEVFGTAAMRKPKAKPKAAAAKPKAAAAKPAAAKPKAGVSKFGVGTSKTITHKGKEMANVTAEQLKGSGLSLRAYMNQWNKTGNRPK